MKDSCLIVVVVAAMVTNLTPVNGWDFWGVSTSTIEQHTKVQTDKSIESETPKSHEYTVAVQYPTDNGVSTAQYTIVNGPSTAQYPNDSGTSTARYVTDNETKLENTEAIEKFDDYITDIIIKNNGSLHNDTSLYDQEFDDFYNSTTTSSAGHNELKTIVPGKVEDDIRNDESENETVLNKLCDWTISGNCSFEENVTNVHNDLTAVYEETNVTENQFITTPSFTVSDFDTYKTGNQYSSSSSSMIPDVQQDTTTGNQYNVTSSPTLFDMELTEDFSEVGWESSVQDVQPEPTWIDAAGSCFVDHVKSDKNPNDCMIMKNETLESALLDIFNSTVIRKLVKRCMPGEWCLRHHPHWKPEPETIHRLCDVLSCLTNRESNFDCPNLLVIRSATELMCNISKADVSSDCFVSAKMMTHVIVSDVVRKMVQIEDEKSFCSVIEEKEQCSGQCRKVSNDVHCMCSSCDHNMSLFQGIDEWQWFLNMKDSSEKCELNSTDCSLFEARSSIKSKEPSRYPQHGAHQLVKILLNSEWHLVALLSLSVVFSLLVVSSIFIALRCHRNRRLRRRLMKQNALMGNDKTFHDDRYARDKVQYTIINTHPDDDIDEES